MAAWAASSEAPKRNGDATGHGKCATDRLISGALLAGSHRTRPDRTDCSAGFVSGKSWGSATTVRSRLHANQQPEADAELQVQNLDTVVAAPAPVPTVLPVTVRPEMQSPTARPQRPSLAPACAPTGTIEIEIGNARVRLRGTVDDAGVRSESGGQPALRPRLRLARPTRRHPQAAVTRRPGPAAAGQAPGARSLRLPTGNIGQRVADASAALQAARRHRLAHAFANASARTRGLNNFVKLPAVRTR